MCSPCRYQNLAASAVGSMPQGRVDERLRILHCYDIAKSVTTIDKQLNALRHDLNESGVVRPWINPRYQLDNLKSIYKDVTGDGEKADVTSISKDKPVELNQYNVQAYKKVLHTVEVSPDIDGGRGVAEVGYSVSHKVSRDGKYLGVGASYNFDSNKAYVKMIYTW